MTDRENDPVQRQYEAYPYPERDPAEENGPPLIGSPSNPLEIDHFLYAGNRDWSQDFRVLVAGGGTGDALVMLAQVLTDWGVLADIHYLDMSTASRKIAEERIAARGLTNVTFHTGDLLSAPDLGPFDYIDCCGVLHHLPDPVAGASALRSALKPDGGIGVMVYAPYGRTGVYELQEALRMLVGSDAPQDQVRHTKNLLATLPPTNGLARNPFVGDHFQAGDAGLYDLLLHSRDRAYDVNGVYDLLDQAGLSLASFVMPGRYDFSLPVGDPELRQRAASMPVRAQAALTEKLVGNIKAHVFYAVPKGSEEGRVAAVTPESVPHMLGVSASKLAESIWKDGEFKASFDGVAVQRKLPRDAAAVIAAVDGKKSLAEISAGLGWKGKGFLNVFSKLYRPLNNFNLMRFSAHRKTAKPTEKAI